MGSNKYKAILRKGCLWEDPEFLLNQHSVYLEKDSDIDASQIVWKRPSEICRNPKFAKGAEINDIHQGELGDCWVLASAADLSTKPKLFHRVVPQDQAFKSFDENESSGYCPVAPNAEMMSYLLQRPAEQNQANQASANGQYAGVFRFNFWSKNHWEEVLVDDRLPTYNNELIYMTSKERNEFWGPLLEKAYAKFKGSYRKLSGGQTYISLREFTGGIAGIHDIATDMTTLDLRNRIVNAYKIGALMGCSKSIEDESSLSSNWKKSETANHGLLVKHAYSIVKVATVTVCLGYQSNEVLLLLLRNPWGNKIVWDGAWSDSSDKWKNLTWQEKERIGVCVSEGDNGEFWISFEDFVKEFQRLDICYPGPDLPADIERDSLKKHTKIWNGPEFLGFSEIDV